MLFFVLLEIIFLKYCDIYANLHGNSYILVSSNTTCEVHLIKLDLFRLFVSLNKLINLLRGQDLILKLLCQVRSLQNKLLGLKEEFVGVFVVIFMFLLFIQVFKNFVCLVLLGFQVKFRHWFLIYSFFVLHKQFLVFITKCFNCSKF